MAAQYHADLLASDGITIMGGGDRAGVHYEPAQIARHIHSTRLKGIGFFPATDRIASRTVGMQLVSALIEITCATHALVRSNSRKPTLDAESLMDREVGNFANIEQFMIHLKYGIPLIFYTSKGL